MSPSCLLLRLPLELRYVIYDHLCRQEPKSYPFTSGLLVASVDQRGPPAALLVSCQYLYQELQTFFYANVTLGFVALARPACFEKPIDLITLGAIKKVKKISVRLVWDGYAGDDFVGRYIMNGWLADLIDLLLDTARCLEVITLSVVDLLGKRVAWEARERMLDPLRKVAGRVRVRLGVVVAEEAEEEELRGWLGGYLRGLGGVEGEIFGD